MPIQTIAATLLLDGTQLLGERQEVVKEEAATAMVGGETVGKPQRKSVPRFWGHR